eukprot:SAG22_NODE_120_length_19227_cov_7.584013_4_plen_205_part_00
MFFGFALACSQDAHGFVKAAEVELSKRPRTLLHGDLRSDNIFKAKEGDPAATAPYKFIDWQCLSPGPGGVDFVQLCTACMQPPVRHCLLLAGFAGESRDCGCSFCSPSWKFHALNRAGGIILQEDYSRLDELLKAYHDRLTEVNPKAAAAYNYDTMKKDYAIGSALIWVAFIGKLTPIMQALVDIDGHPVCVYFLPSCHSGGWL